MKKKCNRYSRSRTENDVPPRSLLTLPPALPPRGVELHEHVTLLEAADSFQLKVLAENPRIGAHLLSYLSDTVALVDAAAIDDLIEALRAEGDPPRVLDGRS